MNDKSEDYSEDVPSLKKLLRKKFLSARAGIAPEDRAVYDRAITEKVLEMKEFREADTVAGYATDGTEPDVFPILRAKLRSGGRVCLPKWNGTEYILSYITEDELDKLVPGKWNLPEPVTTEPADLEKFSGVILVPGAAFDPSFVRLGRGGGIYDRFLRPGKRRFALGVFYECQRVLTLPAEPHDVLLDGVVTQLAVQKRIT